MLRRPRLVIVWTVIDLQPKHQDTTSGGERFTLFSIFSINVFGGGAGFTRSPSDEQSVQATRVRVILFDRIMLFQPA
jgi:hypothetical protein